MDSVEIDKMIVESMKRLMLEEDLKSFAHFFVIHSVYISKKWQKSDKLYFSPVVKTDYGYLTDYSILIDALSRWLGMPEFAPVMSFGRDIQKSTTEQRMLFFVSFLQYVKNFLYIESPTIFLTSWHKRQDKISRFGGYFIPRLIAHSEQTEFSAITPNLVAQYASIYIQKKWIDAIPSRAEDKESFNRIVEDERMKVSKYFGNAACKNWWDAQHVAPRYLAV